MKLRTLIFWPHLIAGVTAGAVILLMCVTGALLTYERQMIAWADRHFRSTPPSTSAARLPIETLLDRVRQHRLDIQPTTIAIGSGSDAPVMITAPERTLFADAYSGVVLGEGSQRVRLLMSELRAWHRWLAVDGDRRPFARAITGWSNLLFLFIVVSGVYLWFPRTWRWQHVKPVVAFNGSLRGKARDFNWHNVTGAWSALVLFIVVLGAVPISFPWATALVYRIVGEEPPSPAGGRVVAPRTPPAAGAGQSNRRSRDRRPTGERDNETSNVLTRLDGLMARAERQVRGWRTINVRIPVTPDGPVVFAIDQGDGGQPQLRSTLTLDRATGAVVSYETFGDQSLGRRLRSILRFAHTGEVLGLTGQTMAGMASAGGALLVCTGFALAWRRLLAWQKRRVPRAVPQTRSPVAGSVVPKSAGLIYGEEQ